MANHPLARPAAWHPRQHPGRGQDPACGTMGAPDAVLAGAPAQFHGSEPPLLFNQER